MKLDAGRMSVGTSRTYFMSIFGYFEGFLGPQNKRVTFHETFLTQFGGCLYSYSPVRGAQGPWPLSVFQNSRRKTRKLRRDVFDFSGPKRSFFWVFLVRPGFLTPKKQFRRLALLKDEAFESHL